VYQVEAARSSGLEIEPLPWPVAEVAPELEAAAPGPAPEPRAGSLEAVVEGAVVASTAEAVAALVPAVAVESVRAAAVELETAAPGPEDEIAVEPEEVLLPGLGAEPPPALEAAPAVDLVPVP